MKMSLENYRYENRQKKKKKLLTDPSKTSKRAHSHYCLASLYLNYVQLSDVNEFTLFSSGTYIDGKGFFKNFKKKAHDYDYLDNIASDPYSGKKHLENPEAEGILAKKIHLMFHRCLDAFFKGEMVWVMLVLVGECVQHDRYNDFVFNAIFSVKREE
ncbi:hypothetical protein RhiirA1_400563 [Rhizophagus irregularis]|uniref:Uncharacterized protein n=1 Tax=Rhizophagus irregularis TaxID=588596 RepID=A0A2N0R5G3_9GLOM|nr:hypothetical protein RhiirA1_400563 [Rhizophagus irregularis]